MPRRLSSLGAPESLLFLHHEAVDPAAGRQAFLLQQSAELVAFAAESDDQHRGEVRMARIAPERAAQQLHRLAAHLHAAADGMAEGHHADYVTTFVKPPPPPESESLNA